MKTKSFPHDADIMNRHSAGESGREIGRRLNLPRAYVNRRIRAMGLKLNFAPGFPPGCGSGEKNGRWNGGRFNLKGYVRFLREDNSKPRYIFEHRLVAEKKLGRSLKFYGVNDRRNEVVHHVNGNKADNREENLVVMTHGEHVRLHSARALDWPDAPGRRAPKSDDRQGAAAVGAA